MKANTTIMTSNKSLVEALVTNFATVARRPLEALANGYSQLLGERLTGPQTLHLVNAQLAFTLTVFSDCAPLVRCLLLTWLVGALLKCREALKG